MQRRTVMRYLGGKGMLAADIVAQMNSHIIYAEPFCGAASVLMAKPRAKIEAINDKEGLVTNVFTQIRDNPEALADKCRLIPFSQHQLDAHVTSEEIAAIDDPLYRAATYLFKSFASFNGLTDEVRKEIFSFPSQNNGAPAWREYPPAIIDFAERLQGVAIHNKDAIKMIKQYDDKDALLYCDPPYVAETRTGNNKRGSTYTHEMTEEDHRELAEALHAHKGMVMLSGYPSPLYDDDLYKGWKRIDFATANRLHNRRIDCLWVNPAAVKQGGLL